MSSEDHPIVKTPSLDKTPETVEEQPTATRGENTDLRPASNMSSSSGATKESFSVYADNTLRSLATNDPSLDITFLSTTTQVPQSIELEPEPAKASESEALETRHQGKHQGDPKEQGIFSEIDALPIDWTQDRVKNYFETDASEVKDLYDSTGIDGLLDRPTSSIVDLNPNSSGEGEEPEQRNAVSKEGEPDIQSSCPKFPKQMSANGRALLRKHFSTTNPVELPRRHTTVAYSEPQIQSSKRKNRSLNLLH